MSTKLWEATKSAYQYTLHGISILLTFFVLASVKIGGEVLIDPYPNQRIREMLATIVSIAAVLFVLRAIPIILSYQAVGKVKADSQPRE